MTRVIFRGWLRGALVFEDREDLPDSLVDDNDVLGLAMDELVAMHSALLGIDVDPQPPHMIEVEFIDAPLKDRFFRFGNDPSMMVEPRRIT